MFVMYSIIVLVVIFHKVKGFLYQNCLHSNYTCVCLVQTVLWVLQSTSEAHNSLLSCYIASSKTHLVFHLISPFPITPFHFFPSLICLLPWQSRGLKQKPSTNTKALEHVVEKRKSVWNRLEKSNSYAIFFFLPHMDTNS